MAKFESQAKIIAVASGKGGVGKTSLAVNLAIALAERGRKVLIFDADLGLANVDIMMGLTPRTNIRDVVDRKCDLESVILHGPEGVDIVPAASGVPRLAELSSEHSGKLLGELSALAMNYDMLLVDVSAGVGSNALRFCRFADEVLLVTTPEPTAVTDAYALTKLLIAKDPPPAIDLVVNMVGNEQEGLRLADAFGEITGRFLNYRTNYLGHIPWDLRVTQAVRRQQPFLKIYPNCMASKWLRLIANKLGAPSEALVLAAQTGFPFQNRISRWLDSWQKTEG